MQVLVAIVYVICITFAGLCLNESAREVLTPALHFHAVDSSSRFNITRIAVRIQTQHPAWGVSVWRALPVERSLLFSVSGGWVRPMHRSSASSPRMPCCC